MRKFKYITSSADGRNQETWVCSKCKMDNHELILLKKWVLIDMSGDPRPCELCELKLVDGEAIAV